MNAKMDNKHIKYSIINNTYSLFLEFYMIGGRLLPFHQEKRRYNLKESLNGKGLPEAHCKTRQRAGVRGEIGVHEKNLVYR